nr:integrase, catalytic region, zinc finger, CCHC-type, peptidase aspartic, catalytic [Tanacetum cinerariifolium]
MNDPECVTRKRITPSAIIDGERGFEQTKACYLQEIIPFFKTLKDNIKGIQKALTKEVKEMKDVFEELQAEEVFCVATNSELNIARLTDMHVANTNAETRCLALEAELANLRETKNQDNQTELINHFSKLEVSHLNLQLKYQNLKDQIGNSPPTPDKDTPDFDSVLVIGKMQDSLQGKDNVIRQLKKELSQLQVTHFQAQNDMFRAENDKVKHHYKQLYDSIKITHAKHIEQVTKLTAKNVTLKTSVSKAKVQPSVLTRTKHVVDVELIVPRLRNNRDAHLDYLRHLKESVETIRDIIEEAKVVRPLDRSIVSACHYTKHSQELLEYAIGTCPHGVDCCTIASRSQPMSHVKPNRISPAKDKMADVNAPSDQTLTMAPPGIVTRANIDYAKRIWEEFTQSIHTFIEDKRNLSRHTSGKKRATLIVIPSIRFTKLIIHHLQRKHKFHPRSNSPLHLSNEEPILGYLKFSAKGTKREIFGMPIPSKHITANIREAPYYQEYQENEASVHCLETPLKHSISSPVTSTQPGPTSVPAKTQENKCKQATGTTDKPAKAKRIKHSASRKAHQPRSSPKSVGESEAEEVHAEELQVTDEDADFQKALEESMKDAYALPKGPLPLVVIRELESGKISTSPRNSEEESEKIMLGVEKGSQDEGQAGSNPDETSEGQAGSNPDETSEGQAGSNPDETSEGQAGPNLGNAEARVQSTSSPMVYAGSDLEHMDLDVDNVSPQPSTEQLYDGFTATVYPNVQENLKLAVEESVLLEEPASSSGTLSFLQHLSRDFSFGDQFFSDKPSDADKSTETKVESMPPPPPPPVGPSGTSGAPSAFGSQVTPPPPPPTSTNQDSLSKGLAAPSPTKTAATTEHQAWSTPDVTLKPLVSLTPEDLDMDEAMVLDEQA